MHLQTVGPLLGRVQFHSLERRWVSTHAGPYIGWFGLGWGEQVGTERAARPPPMGHTAVAMVNLMWCSMGGSEMNESLVNYIILKILCDMFMVMTLQCAFMNMCHMCNCMSNLCVNFLRGAAKGCKLKFCVNSQ